MPRKDCPVNERFTQHDDDWWRVENFDPLPATHIWLRVARVDGEPRCIAVNIEPEDDAAALPLTSQAMRRLPLTRWAALIDAAADWRHRPGLRDHLRPQPPKASMSPRPPRIDLEAIARVWNDAYDGHVQSLRGPGKATPQQAVAERFRLSDRTAARYVKRAREAGLITRYMRPQVAKAAAKRGRKTPAIDADEPRTAR